MKITRIFKTFFESEKSAGLILIGCTLLSLLIANSIWSDHYLHFWNQKVSNHEITHWINDGLMAIFFLLIGLELRREIYIGELSNIKNARLPMCAAIGGMLVPALIHFSLNQATPTQNGIFIPMATDIAFALGVLTILGNRIPASLKVFVVAFAVIDDLGAILIIAAFYTAKLSVWYLIVAFVVWALLMLLNHFFRVMTLLPYLIGGVLMWILMLKSGIHATAAGVMLAFVIPFSEKDDDQASPSYKLENLLHKPVAFIILPIFALVNTGITLSGDWMHDLSSLNSLGIAMGLILGKPLGITLFCFMVVAIGVCRLPSDLKWGHIIGAGILGGIGFTMSIFITNLAFTEDPATINAAKMSILIASLTAGILGFLWLRITQRTQP